MPWRILRVDRLAVAIKMNSQADLLTLSSHSFPFVSMGIITACETVVSIVDNEDVMPAIKKKRNYEEKFSGKTRAIIMTLTRIFLDSNLDVREKHMFGHKAFLVKGHVMMLVGEWSRNEKPKEHIVQVDGTGAPEPTLILLPLDAGTAEVWRKTYKGLYFAPSGVRLKNWLSLSGSWLMDEDKLLPIVEELLTAYEDLPFKALKNPGYTI